MMSLLKGAYYEKADLYFSTGGCNDDMMDTLYECHVKNGVGVVIDEFGARDKGGNIQARAFFAQWEAET